MKVFQHKGDIQERDFTGSDSHEAPGMGHKKNTEGGATKQVQYGGGNMNYLLYMEGGDD